MTLAPQMTTALSKIAEGSAIDGYMFANAKSPMLRALVKEGMVENDPANVDPNDADKSAFRLTEKGQAEMGLSGATPPATDAANGTGLTPTGDVPVQQIPAGKRGRKAGEKRGPMVAPVIVGSTARMMALPDAPTAGKRGGQRGESYPFAKLMPPNAEGFDSFFVQQTDDMPNAFKTVKAAVASANKRYLKKGGNEFTTRAVSENGLDGARVYRVK